VKRIDGRVARLLTDIQVVPAEDAGKRLKAAATVEDKCQRRVLLGVLEQERALWGFVGFIVEGEKTVRAAVQCPTHGMRPHEWGTRGMSDLYV
jgi:hypothetical protein